MGLVRKIRTFMAGLKATPLEIQRKAQRRLRCSPTFCLQWPDRPTMRRPLLRSTALNLHLTRPGHLLENGVGALSCVSKICHERFNDDDVIEVLFQSSRSSAGSSANELDGFRERPLVGEAGLEVPQVALRPPHQPPDLLAPWVGCAES